MTNPDAATQARVGLLDKLRKVAEAIQFVEKRGRNDHHGYNFAQAVDVTREVRNKLLERGVIVVPSTVPGSVRHFTETGGRSFVTTVDLIYRFTCTETGAEVEVAWTGAGSDTGGDKGIYKAYTGGLKYALISLFLLPTTDDPEHDALTQTQPPTQAAPAPTADDERPPATTIPLDRAKAILESAIAAGLASWADQAQPPVMEPVLKAKLADLGVARIGELNVDQAEALEAFITEEAASAAGGAS